MSAAARSTASRGLGRTGAQEVVAAVGELVQVDLVGQQPPLAVPPGEAGRARVVGGDDHGDRRRQLRGGWVVERVERSSGGPTRSRAGRRRRRARRAGRPARRGRCSRRRRRAGRRCRRRSARTARRRGAPAVGVAEQLRAEEHPPHRHTPRLERAGRRHGRARCPRSGPTAGRRSGRGGRSPPRPARRPGRPHDGANGSRSAARSCPGSSTAYTASPLPRSARAIGWKFTALPPAYGKQTSAPAGVAVRFRQRPAAAPRATRRPLPAARTGRRSARPGRPGPGGG